MIHEMLPPIGGGGGETPIEENIGLHTHNATGTGNTTVTFPNTPKKFYYVKYWYNDSTNYYFIDLEKQEATDLKTGNSATYSDIIKSVSGKTVSVANGSSYKVIHFFCYYY